MVLYSKFFVAIGGWFALLGEALADGAVSAAETGGLVTVAITAIGVFFAPREIR